MDNATEESIMDIIGKLKKIDYINPEDIPNIDLYMDQVTTFMEKELASSKRHEDDKILTKTMINNYAKNNLLPPPVKKKYSREHMLLLVFIYYFKNMLSFHDIEALFAPITEGHFMDASGLSLQDIYEEVFSMEYEQMKRLKEDLLRKFHASEESFTDQKEDKDYLQLFTFICALGFDVFLKKQAMEMLIDQIREDYPVDHSKKKKS